MVELGSTFLINQIKMELYDEYEDRREYSYYIEVSVDRNNWHRIIDYTNYNCSSTQDLHFPSQAVRFIKLVGTNSTADLNFHASELKVYYTLKPQKSIDGVVSPSHDVIYHGWRSGTAIIKGKFLNRNTLLPTLLDSDFTDCTDNSDICI